MGTGGWHTHLRATPPGGVSSLDLASALSPGLGPFLAKGTGEMGAAGMSKSYNIIPVENTCEPEAVHTWS
jgi:hypothetical protein